MNDLDNWVPAKSRTYQVPIVEPGSEQQRIVLSEKSSQDVIDFAFDFSRWLDDPNDKIIKFSVDVLNLQNGSYNLVIPFTKLSGSYILAMFASGYPGMQNVINVTIETDFGRIFVQQFTMFISNFSSAFEYPYSVLPDDITWNGGVAMSGTKPLPAGYFTNGGVVSDAQATDTDGAGSPHFKGLQVDDWSGLPGELNDISEITGASAAISALASVEDPSAFLLAIEGMTKFIPLLTAMQTLPSGKGAFIVDDTGAVSLFPGSVSDIPSGLSLNDNVYMAPDGIDLPAGLSSNGGVIMTDGTVFYRGTVSNGGILCNFSSVLGQ